MKKIITLIALIFMMGAFTSCEKEEITEKGKGGGYSYLMQCSNCGADASKLNIFYPPSHLKDEMPQYTCTVCGHSGTFIKVYI